MSGFVALSISPAARRLRRVNEKLCSLSHQLCLLVRLSVPKITRRPLASKLATETKFLAYQCTAAGLFLILHINLFGWTLLMQYSVIIQQFCI